MLRAPVSPWSSSWIQRGNGLQIQQGRVEGIRIPGKGGISPPPAPGHLSPSISRAQDHPQAGNAVGWGLRLPPPFPHPWNVFHVCSSLCVEPLSPKLFLAPAPSPPCSFPSPSASPRGVSISFSWILSRFCATSVSPQHEGLAWRLVAPAQSHSQHKEEAKVGFWGILGNNKE